MTEVTLNLGAPFRKQREFLGINRRVVNEHGELGISHSNYVGGRGCSKTTTGILLLLQAVADMPGLRGFWAEPRWSDIERVFLTALEAYVPRTLWTLCNKSGFRYIKWINGHETDLLARQVDDPKKRVALGSNYAYGIQDEGADKFSRNKFIDMQNAIRLPSAPYLFHDTLSTPLVGGYESWCKQPGARIVTSSSRDNPYISNAVIDAWAAAMTPDLVRQEIEGQFIQLAGRIWNGFVEAPWPNGNIIEGVEFNPSQPFYLAADLGGAQSAFQVVQYVDPIHNGRRMFDGRLAVVVAELTPNRMGLPAVLDEIVNTYCGGYDGNGRPKRSPVKVLIGHDVASPGNVMPGSQVLMSLGWEWQTPSGAYSGKDIQRQAASALIYNNSGQRRFAIAAKRGSDGIYQIARQHFGEGKTRGLLNVMRNDTYPDASSREVFRKDKGERGENALEDDRDAFLYWVVCNHPPPWGLGAHRGREAA